MTHHTRRLAAIAVLLVVASVLAPAATAAPLTPAGGGPSTPAPTSTPTSTTPEPTPPPTPTGNGSGSGTGGTGNGGGGGNWVFNAISDGIIDAVEELGVNQAIEATGNLSTAAIELSAYTPHANNAANWHHNPTNNAWPKLWDYFQTLGLPLWALAVGIGLLLGVGFYASGIMSRQEYVEWRRRWLVGLIGGRWAWELGNTYLYVLGGLKKGIVASGTAGPELGAMLSTGLVLILIVALAWWSLAAVALVVLIIVASVVGIEVLTPFLGALLAARAIPFAIIHKPADKVSRMWAILPILTVPMVLSLSLGFSVGLTGSGASSGIVGALMPILVFLGAIGFAIVSPYIVWSSMSTAGALSVGFAGGSIAMSQKYERAKQGAKSAAGKGRESARGARDAVRGARGKAPVADGGRGYDAGRSLRQTGSAVRGNRKEGVRSRVRRKYAESKYATLESRRRRREAVDKVRGPGRNSTLRGLVNDNNNE